MASTAVLKVVVIYLYFFCEVTKSKKLNPPDPKLNKLKECERCKLLTDSFNYWIEKTARSNYAGGDTAWEEAKLKSYARSEVRLVEVQEGLCSELRKNQDECYMLAEEAEQVLEKWWFNEDPNGADLYTWLCIDTLKNCCPSNHFGEFCKPCPLDKENNICSGHGKCDGEGTRQGSGSCICQRGFIGDYCKECDKNFYAVDSSCKPCHKACDGCSSTGPAACHRCKSGWELEQTSNTCIDIDECLLESLCKTNQFCVNKEGSYKCKSCDSSCNTCKGPGASNCTTCDSSYLLWSQMCITDKQKTEILNSSVKRSSLYLGLLLIAFFIYRKSKPLASLVIIIISIYVYFSEQSYKINLLDVLNNMLGYNLVDHL